MSSRACFITMIDVSRSKYCSAGLSLTVTLPLPAESQTRAMAVLRLPVAYVRVVAVLIGTFVLSLDLEDLGLLRDVRMIRRRVDLQLAEHLAAEDVLREHALHGLLDREGGLVLEEVAVARGLEAAGDARVTVVELLVEVVARELHLVGVDDDDEVARVAMRREGGLVLAAEAR